ncbi:hypothetical protein MPSEU_000941700 [Mayamaea pseudoterrestris]|nr:hypothetical protein MPSEU_000941700 [Mayamaea pseudoterrestris]
MVMSPPSTSSSMLWTALTPSSQSVVAVLDPSSIDNGGSLRVLLLQTTTGKQQQNSNLLMTLTHRQKQDASSQQQDVQALFFVNDSTLCLLTRRELVIWDVTRGVVAFSMVAEQNQTFVHAAPASEEHQLLLLVQTPESSKKCQVHLYDTTTQKLIRKIKVGKLCRQVAPALGSVLVRSNDAVKLVASDTGSRLQKYEDLGDFAGLAVAENIGVTISNGRLLVMNLQTGSNRTMDLPEGDSAPHSAVQMIALDSDSDDGATCLFNYSRGLYAIDPDRASLRLLCKISTPADDHNWSLCMGSDQLVAVTKHQDRNEFRVLTRPVDQIIAESIKTPMDWDLEWKSDLDASANDETTKSGSKRKPQPSILGPGQKGGEARGVSDIAAKKFKLDENNDGMDVDANGAEDNDDDGPTVAERLALLQQALDDESADEEAYDNDGKDGKPAFDSKRATTESLSQLLQQALQSGDDPMLELALLVRDKQVIEESCLALSSEQAAMLLAALTTRLAMKPGRADHMCTWLSTLLLTNKVKSLAHLQPLQNLLEERVEIFPSLLKLDGRLSMMASKYLSK